MNMVKKNTSSYMILRGPMIEFIPVLKQIRLRITKLKLTTKLAKVSHLGYKYLPERVLGLTDISNCFLQRSSMNQFRMISNKTPLTNSSEEESDHYYSDLSFELDNTPRQLQLKL